MRLMCLRIVRSMSKLLALTLRSPIPFGTDVPPYRLTKMRFAYKNSKNPFGLNTYTLHS